MYSSQSSARFALRSFVRSIPCVMAGWLLVACLGVGSQRVAAADSTAWPTPVVLVVMDPLAKPLSCPCVQGYAQRDYELLGDHLQKELGVDVRVVFGESLSACMKKPEAAGAAHLIIGKHSVIEYDAKRAKVDARPIARLTDKQGATTMTGLVVVPTGDQAKSVADLSGYRIVFGPEECEEKHTAALQLLTANKVDPPADLETSPACDEGAIAILEGAKRGERGAAVISSYAKPLLEGCGTVEKGSLRVVGETEPVPFIEAFVSSQLSETQQEKLTETLLKSTRDVALRLALETRDGFMAIDAVGKATADQASVDVKKKNR